MKVVIIGRSETLYNTAILLNNSGHEIVCIVTAKEAPDYKRSLDDFAILAESWSIPLLIGSNIDKHSLLLQATNACIGVSINFPGIIPQYIIDMFPLGILNAHGGDLPRYRGNACQAWAILNGESQIGLCIHRMVGGELDSGDIIARDYYPLTNNTKITKVYEFFTKRVPELYLLALCRLAVNPLFCLDVQSKNKEDALRCYPRRPEDGRIDWDKPALYILRLINASNKPYEGAFCEYEGKKLIIWDAELVVDHEIFFAVPGQITQIGKGFIEIACGENKLRLLEIEIENKTVKPDTVIRSIRKRLT